MNVIIETDIGRDADDLFALLYFIASGVTIDAIIVSPGDHDQVAVVRALLDHFDIKCPIITPAARVSKEVISNFHKWAIEHLGGKQIVMPDGHEELIPKGKADLFVCGPAKLAHLVDAKSITFQGGFVPYSMYKPTKTLDKFDGKEYCATYNLGGTKPAVATALLEMDVPHRWVGKNVCHTVVYTPEIHKQYSHIAESSKAGRLHNLFISKYMEKAGAKAFHDPLAAMLMLNKEHGLWMQLKPHRERGEWSAKSTDEQHWSLVDLMYEPWEPYMRGLARTR
jgi:inosine-uridine nucleoside N-ribohydrolase